MIPRINSAELVREDVWLVYFNDPDQLRFPIVRLVPIDDSPATCPGGELWCKQFGCVPGDNVFTRSEPEILVEDGQEIPVIDWKFEGETEETMAPNWGGKGECWACDERVLHTEKSCWENSPGLDH